ncbi:hypothetical protein ACQPZG_24715 [Streptomyces sp. CA-294286]|uniref:hypothetical protein n=1 Tax=Streptomyces sp. CA-294286 TaxID=3240070 RepID=UPI003D8E6619
MTKILRGVAYVALPGELVVLVCLLSGVRVPGAVLAGVEALVVAVVLAELTVFVSLRRRGLTTREAVAALVPEKPRRLVGHELRVMASIGRWVARRPHGVGAGVLAFGHAKAQAALLGAFAFVCVVETAVLHVLLAGAPVVQTVFLVLDVYTVVLIVGLHAAAVTRPHVVRADGSLRVRSGAHADLLLPAARIASVRYELRLNPGAKEDGVLELAAASQTSVTVELHEPVEHVALLGARRPVTTVRFHADDARALVAAVGRRRAASGPALTRARTGPSPSPGPPASA